MDDAVPPPLPTGLPPVIPPAAPQMPPAADARQRFARWTRMNGLSIAIIAALSIPPAFWMEGGVATVCAAAAASCGLAEYLSGRRLQAGDAGRTWMAPAAEVVLFFVIALYATDRLRNFDAGAMLRLLPGFIHELADEAMIPRSELVRLLHLSNSLSCGLLVLLALGYQGGMALFYQRLRRTMSRGAEAHRVHP